MALKPVPKDNKGLGKLPTEVRNKMGFMAKGGRVIPKPMKAQAKPARAKPTMTKPRPINLGTTPKPTTFTGKINTETQKLQNIDGKTVVVNKSNESGRSISDADRARVSKMMGKSKVAMKKPRGMEKGGEAKKTGSMASRKKNREYTKLDYEKDKFKEVAKRVGKVAKTPYNLVTKGMAGAFKEFSELVDTPMPKFPKVGSRKKNVVKKNKGGLVKGGTSSQMSGQHYKGTF